MSTSPLNIKAKIAFHSLGIAFALSALLLISIAVNETSITRYLIMGLLAVKICMIIFSRRRYMMSVRQDDFTITITYLNRTLVAKSISIEKQGLNMLYIKEVNWWYGELDQVTFSNEKQNLTFDCIDKTLKKTAHEIIG